MYLTMEMAMVKHNDRAVFITKVHGIRERRGLIFKERLGRRGWEEYTNGYDSYLCGYDPPNYPVPTKMGEVTWLYHGGELSITVQDCEEAYDPQCVWIGFYADWQTNTGDVVVMSDQPNDSPNYR